MVDCQVPKGNWKVMAFYLNDDFRPASVKGGSVDYLDRDAVSKYIAINFEPYYTHLKEFFGTVIKRTFYDEPSILSYGLKGGYYPNKTQTNSPAPSLINGRLFSFDGTILSDSDRIAVMAEVGYRPAYLVELLTLGWQYPTLQYSYTICALGTEYRPYDTRSGSWPLYPYLMARKAFILDPRPWPSQDKEKNLYLAILVDEGK